MRWLSDDYRLSQGQTGGVRQLSQRHDRAREQMGTGRKTAPRPVVEAPGLGAEERVRDYRLIVIAMMGKGLISH